MAGKIKSTLPSFANDAVINTTGSGKSFSDIINFPTPGKFVPGSNYTELALSQMYKQNRAMAEAEAKKANKNELKSYKRLGGRQPPHDYRAAQVLGALGIYEDLMKAIIASAQLAPTVR